MIVSRETFLDTLVGAKKNKGVGGFKISSYDLLPLVLGSFKGVCLVVDDSFLGSVFSHLYKHSFSDLVVFTNRPSSAPRGFRSALDRCKNRGALGDNFSGVVVVDKTTFGAGFVEVLSKTKMFCVDYYVEYDDLISALGGSGYIRCPSVSSPGD